MAYIYFKNTGRCLVLEPQESLSYPFNLGAYQEIRWGGFFSLTSGGTGNMNTPFPATNGTISSPLQMFFMGFKDTGTALPLSPNASFIGISKLPGDASFSITSSQLNFSSSPGTGPGSFCTIDTFGRQTFFNAHTQNFIPLTTATGDTNFGSFWGMTLGLQGNTWSGMAIYDTNFYTDVSTGKLSALINAPPLTSTFVTGFYTTGNLNNSNNFPIPGAIYIYFPFLTSQLRIHSLDIELFS